MSSTTWLLFIALVLGGMGTGFSTAQTAGSDVLARSIARYSTLESYADTGTVVREAPGLVDRRKFTTYYRRASLDFYFDFRGVAATVAAGIGCRRRAIPPGAHCLSQRDRVLFGGEPTCCFHQAH